MALITHGVGQVGERAADRRSGSGSHEQRPAKGRRRCRPPWRCVHRTRFRCGSIEMTAKAVVSPGDERGCTDRAEQCAAHQAAKIGAVIIAEHQNQWPAVLQAQPGGSDGQFRRGIRPAMEAARRDAGPSESRKDPVVLREQRQASKATRQRAHAQSRRRSHGNSRLACAGLRWWASPEYRVSATLFMATSIGMRTIWCALSTQPYVVSCSLSAARKRCISCRGLGCSRGSG